MRLLAAVACGFCLDFFIGDPQGVWHPVMAIGKLISICENRIRKRFPKTVKGEKLGGTLLWLCVTIPSFMIPFLILYIAKAINIWLYFALETLFCYQIFAARSLKRESMRVFNALKQGKLQEARHYLSWIVGRVTEHLDEQQVARAAVETVAENTSDGVTAPMMFMLIGGAPLAFLYKAVNTLDSMVGYKNEKYLYFGRFSAKMDDLFNFIPARLTGLMMIPATLILRLNAKNAAKIFFRDRKNHSSPNSAQTEAACAGALGIRLGGDAYYSGKLVKKPTIGDPIRPIVPEDIKRANNLMYLTAALSLLLYGGIRFLIFL